MESDCNRVFRELLGSGWYWGYGGRGYWIVLGILVVLLGTGGYWVLEGTRGTVGFCWVL